MPLLHAGVSVWRSQIRMGKDGAAIAELAARTDGAISLAMPVEASGGPWFRYAYDDWQAHAGFFATDHAKIVIRDNPGLEPGQRAAQAERVAKVSDWAAANDRALIVELLAPAGLADLTALGGAAASYDAQRCGPSTPCRSWSLRKTTGSRPRGGRWRASTVRRRGRDRRGRPSAAAEPPTASSSAGTPITTTTLTTGCRSRRPFRASPASPSAAASGGTHCTPICTTAAPPAGLGAGSPASIPTSFVTSSTPATARSQCRTCPKPCNHGPFGRSKDLQPNGP